MFNWVRRSYKNGWLGKIVEELEHKENRFARLYLTDPAGGKQRYPYDYASHLCAYIADVWIYASIRAIAEAVSGIPLLVQRKYIVDSEDVWETVSDHPLANMLSNPNPEDPSSYLISMYVTNAYLTGNGYMHHAILDRELYILPSDSVKVVKDSQGQNPSYVVEKNISSYNAAFDEIIHWKLYSPKNNNYGLPPSEVIKETIMTKIALSGFLQRYFVNDASPSTILSTEQPLSEQQRKVARQEFEFIHKGYKNSHKLAILDSGTKMEKMVPSIKELMPVDLYRFMREEILAAYGVPHVMVGVLDDASYANAEVQKQVFYENRVLPTLNMIEEILTRQLVPHFGNNLRVWFDRTTIEALQEDKAIKARTLTYYTGGKPVMTQNEARQELGLEAVEGGDDLSMPSISLPDYGGDGEKPNKTKPADKPVDEEDDNKSHRIIRVNKLSPLRLAKEEKWVYHYENVKSLEESFARRMNKFFDAQLGRVLDRLQSLKNDRGELSLMALYAKVSQMKINEEDTGGLLPKKIENRKLKNYVEIIFKGELRRAGEREMARQGVTLGFNVSTPEVFAVLEGAKNRIVKVNNYTYDLIRGVLKEGYEEGWGIDKIAKEIRGTYKEFSKPRSIRIAQTEMNGIVNGGYLEGGAQSGAEKKEWVSAQLPTSRQWHIDAQYQGLIPIRKRFVVGDSHMLYPSDPSGLPEDVINCYCGVVTH